MDTNSIIDFVLGADGGALLIVMWAVSWGLEDFAWWHALATKARQLIILGAAMLLGILAVLLQNSPELVAAIDPYVKPMAGILLFWITSQGAHKVDTRNNLAKEAIIIQTQVETSLDENTQALDENTESVK